MSGPDQLSDQPFYDRGILSGPIDLDGGRPRPSYPSVEAVTGLEVTQRGTGLRGVIVSSSGALVTVRDPNGRDRQLRLRPGGFEVDRRQVTLVPPTAATSAPGRTASGSVAVPGRRLESPGPVASWWRAATTPSWWRRCGATTCAWRAWWSSCWTGLTTWSRWSGASARDRGGGWGCCWTTWWTGRRRHGWPPGSTTPTCWCAVIPSWTCGRRSSPGWRVWPRGPAVPRDEEWKAGVCRRIGVDDPRAFWPRLLGAVSSYADLEPALVGAVERLIDFVTEPS